ncbi:hypothetical protein KR222_002103 [Zaprionus bogoriensis]|nr:hypothetical protein KR222_002103 [Zaprionus bogoriensis]
MAPNTPTACENSEPRVQIATFAVIDLETTNLPANNLNRVSITELCIYAFDAAMLKDNDNASKDPPPLDEDRAVIPLPPQPRVLHKLNLLFRPSMLVHPFAEAVTGLNNFLLERESKLNENAAQMIVKFIEHLPAPVCLVAHNGWHFDYPIVRQAFDRLKVEFPASTLCVDSLRAFIEIDEKRDAEKLYEDIQLELDKLESESTPSSSPIPKEIDWQALNDTTPKRPTVPREESARRRKLLRDDSDDEDGNTAKRSEAKRTRRELHARRQLFSGLNCATTKRYPQRGLYKLGHLFERTFRQPACGAHRAEADVNMLTKLIQHYGIDFHAFAEEQAIPFAQVKPLGS